jgi:hypothetical protein
MMTGHPDIFFVSIIFNTDIAVHLSLIPNLNPFFDAHILSVPSLVRRNLSRTSTDVAQRVDVATLRPYICCPGILWWGGGLQPGKKSKASLI